MLVVNPDVVVIAERDKLALRVLNGLVTRGGRPLTTLPVLPLLHQVEALIQVTPQAGVLRTRVRG